jgi:hypothetical protein
MRPVLHRLLLIVALLIAGCDPQRAARLEEGVSTEADVRKEFGEPAQIIEKANGSKVFAYPRQPEGWTNYEIVIDAEGRMSSLRQLLTLANFAEVRPGMDQAEVRRLLGKHARTVSYAMKPDQEVWQWRFLDGQARKVFEATFDRDGKVLSTAITDDERQTQTGG